MWEAHTANVTIPVATRLGIIEIIRFLQTLRWCFEYIAIIITWISHAIHNGTGEKYDENIQRQY